MSNEMDDGVSLMGCRVGEEVEFVRARGDGVDEVDHEFRSILDADALPDLLLVLHRRSLNEGVGRRHLQVREQGNVLPT